MKSKHLSEKEIQQYAFNKSSCETTVIEHLEECENCKIKAASYQLLFSEIKQQPKPTFDFDLPALVLAQLPRAKPRFSKNDIFISFLVFVALSIIVITVYLFRKFVLNVFTGISTFFIFTICTATIIIIIFKCIDMYRRYQKQMNVLNYY